MKNIIIQAGGLGTRLLTNTKNKPKCLVPVNGKPIIQYILELYPESDFYIIADYKNDILEKYINLFYKKYNIKIIHAEQKGTCAGISLAAREINNDNNILLMWSDLILEEKVKNNDSDIVVYKTDSVTCRYSVKNEKIVKELSEKNGVVGIFSFKNKNILKNIQESGSFVGDWLQKTEKNIIFKDIQKIKEIGTVELLQKNSNNLYCRFFNEVKIIDGKIIKNCINKDFKKVSDDENNWYKFVINKKYKNIPKVYDYNPLILEYIKSNQCNKFNYSHKEKIQILKNISYAMKDLHKLDILEKNNKDIEEVYLSKTLKRVESVKDLIPFFEEEILFINGEVLQNPFCKLNLQNFKKSLKNISCNNFNVIHGDPTFSNILVKENLETVFIDPRGSFGSTKIFGDKDYDYSKLYYSLVGNYDSINTKQFDITFEKNIIQYDLKSNEWEHLEDDFYKFFSIKKSKNLLLNSTIWFSLCGYVVEDYDAILIAFCKGVEYWNKYLQAISQS